MSLRLMIYDATCRGPLPGLSDVWFAGSRWYEARGRLDRAKGIRSWEEGLAWLAEIEADRSIAEIQFWGHGRWGRVLVDGEPLDATALVAGHRHRPALERIRERMAPQAHWWFRTCETFGAAAGQAFAREWTAFFDRPAAGHTFVIGWWQSGLHRLVPGEKPAWSPEEGLASGTSSRPEKALWSRPWSPRTITCLTSAIPSGW